MQHGKVFGVVRIGGVGLAKLGHSGLSEARKKVPGLPPLPQLSISDIARALKKPPGSIHGMLKATGGIAPPQRCRPRWMLSLAERIRDIHERGRGTYGYPRIHAELRSVGIRCGRKRVARLMCKAGLRGRPRGRRRRTTRRDGSAISVPDLAKRDFTVGNRLGEAGIVPSMGRVGSAHDELAGRELCGDTERI